MHSSNYLFLRNQTPRATKAKSSSLFFSKFNMQNQKFEIVSIPSTFLKNWKHLLPKHHMRPGSSTTHGSCLPTLPQTGQRASSTTRFWSKFNFVGSKLLHALQRKILTRLETLRDQINFQTSLPGSVWELWPLLTACNLTPK
jgi:hypothetical protein